MARENDVSLCDTHHCCEGGREGTRAWLQCEHQSCLCQSSHRLPLMKGSFGAPHAEGDTSELPVDEEQVVVWGALGRGTCLYRVKVVPSCRMGDCGNLHPWSNQDEKWDKTINHSGKQ